MTETLAIKGNHNSHTYIITIHIFYIAKLHDIFMYFFIKGLYDDRFTVLIIQAAKIKFDS